MLLRQIRVRPQFDVVIVCVRFCYICERALVKNMCLSKHNTRGTNSCDFSATLMLLTITFWWNAKLWKGHFFFVFWWHLCRERSEI